MGGKINTYYLYSVITVKVLLSQMNIISIVSQQLYNKHSKPFTMQLEMNNVALSTQRVLNIPVLCNSTHTIVDMSMYIHILYTNIILWLTLYSDGEFSL